MAANCDAELCVHWAGSGCVCSVLDLAAEHHRYCECHDCLDDRDVADDDA